MTTARTQVSNSTSTLSFPDGSTLERDTTYTWAAGPPVPAPKKRLRVGNVPRSTMDATGVTEVDQVFNPGSLMRWFCPGSLTVPSANALLYKRDLIGSFKTGTPDPKTAAMYLLVTKDHEIDHQIIQKVTTLEQYQADLDAMAKSGIDNLCTIVTGDAAVNPTKKLTDYLNDNVRYFGFDLDGVSHKVPYSDKRAIIDAGTTFCVKYGLTPFAGEFGADRDTVNDPSGYLRAAWMNDTFAYMDQAGWFGACWWEDKVRQPNSVLRDDAEIWTLRTAMAQSLAS